MKNTPEKRTPPAKTHDEMIAEWMKDPEFKAGYDALEEEYQLIREMILSRKRARLTQREIAERMGTKAPAVARLEAVSYQNKHTPSIGTLRKYAHAVNCQLVIRFKPLKHKPFEKTTSHHKPCHDRPSQPSAS